MALKKKQLVFCEEYVKDYNGRQAAIRAGYKESNAASQASKLLSSPEIIEEIKNRQKKLLEASCLTEEKVISHLEEILNRCLTKSPITEWNYEEHCLVETGQWTFDSKGALKAIELLGKHLGMFEKSDKNNKEIVSNLIEIISDATKGNINTDDIPELQQTADDSTDMVEQT